MMRSVRSGPAALATVLLMAAGLPAVCRFPAAPRPAFAADPPASDVAGVATLPGWLVGSWRLERGDRTITETWFDGGNVLLGLSFTRKGDRTVEFEFLRIEPRDGVLAYVAQPGGRPPTVFPLAASDARSLRFENSAHDFPQVIRYALEGDSALVAEISGPMNGTPRSLRFDYRRVAGN